jgi:oligosaccharide repeat unit polymerase
LLLVLIVGTPTKNLFHAAAQGVGSDAGFLARARSEQVSDLGDQGVLKSALTYFLEYVQYTAVLFLIERRDRFFWFMFAIAFVSSIVGTGRIAFLTLFASLTCVYLIKENRERFLPACRFIRWPFVIFISIFFAMMFLAKDTSGIKSSAASFAETSLIQYIIGPTAALDNVLYHPSDYAGTPNHTFKLLLSAASSAHLTDYKPPPQLDKFLDVPFPTNVYTIYKFYITDFGIPAALLIIAFVGFGHALLYRKAHTTSELGLYMFAVTMGTLIIVIFDDEYSAFGLYLNALVLGAAYLSLRKVPVGISLKLRMKKRRRRRLRLRSLYWVAHRHIAVAPLALQSHEVIVNDPTDEDPETIQ